MAVGKNLDVGWGGEALNDPVRWRRAAIQGMEAEFLERLHNTYATQLGRWFGGQELSRGQWQKIALSRAYMR